jgi:glucoamylase
MSAGAHGDATRVLRYLQATQEPDGHWVQNMWLDGMPYWSGIQMDETAFPILLCGMAWREGMLDPDLLASFWPMVRQAAAYVVANGPVTQEDRWEETGGLSPFTLAVEIAGLLVAAALAESAHEDQAAAYLRETADNWNANIERWTYARGGELCQKFGVDGYYVRIAPAEVAATGDLSQATIEIKNRPPDKSRYPAAAIVSPDALALVRFGLRAPDDPRIVNTLKVVDGLLKLDTPSGPIWRRYNEDGYGEQADGAPFDGTGIGRVWPLLVGERGHYELAAGHHDEAERLLGSMAAFAGSGGMIPEQVWDGDDIPDAELFFGRPSGSAMPLVWAHAEYIKLKRSLREQRVMDMPPDPVARYLKGRQGTPYTTWRFNIPTASMPAGQTLRIETRSPGVVHWSADGWQTTQDLETRDTGLSIHVADLPTKDLEPGAQVEFTFHWVQEGRWEGRNFAVHVA